MANYADLLKAEEQRNSEVKPVIVPAETTKPVTQSIDQSTTQSTDKPIKREKVKTPSSTVSQLTSQPVSRPTNTTAYSKTVDRPKAFYITERLDRKLDEAVRYFQDAHGIKKVDRSTIINACLDNDEAWASEVLDQLVDRVISQLTSRLTGK